jgi:hypothetical protein
MPNDQLLASSMTPDDSSGGVSNIAVDENKYTDPFAKEMASVESFAADQPIIKQLQARTKSDEAAVQASQKNLQGLYKNAPQAPDYEKFKASQNIPELKDESEYAQKAAPSYALLAVFGGLLGRKNARVALSAQGSALEALNQGNHGRYLLAKQAHDDAVSNMDREWKNYMEVYKIARDIHRDDIDAERLSLEMANRAVGVDMKNELTAFGQINTLYSKLQTLREKRKKDDATLDLRREALDISRFRAGTNAKKFWFDKRTKIAAGQEAVDVLENSLEQAQTLWEKLKLDPSYTKFMKGSTVLPSTIQAYLRTKPEYARLNQMLASAAEKALAFQSLGLASTAQRLKPVEVMAIRGLPTLEGKTPEEVTESMRSLLEKVRQQQEFLQIQLKYADQEEAKTAAGDFSPTPMPGAAPPSAAPTQTPGATGATAPKVITAKEVTEYYNNNKAHFPNGEASARAYLESNGYQVK